MRKKRRTVFLAHNLRSQNTEEQAEYDSPKKIKAIKHTLSSLGYRVRLINTNCAVGSWLKKLEGFEAGDVVLNIAEGRKGCGRESLVPCVLEDAGYRYTGPDSRALMLTLDKHTTKLIAESLGITTPKSALLMRDTHYTSYEGSFPAIVKPNFEGTSRGISDASVINNYGLLHSKVSEALDRFPSGVLVEEFITGRDVSVPWVEGYGACAPYHYYFDRGWRTKHNIFDLRLKLKGRQHTHYVLPTTLLTRSPKMSVECMAEAVGCRGVARMDYRVDRDGKAYLLEVNALPDLQPGSSFFASIQHTTGLNYKFTIEQIVEGAFR